MEASSIKYNTGSSVDVTYIGRNSEDEWLSKELHDIYVMTQDKLLLFRNTSEETVGGLKSNILLTEGVSVSNPVMSCKGKEVPELDV